MLSLAAGGLSGCASVVNTVDEFPPKYFGGTRFDWTTLTTPEETGELPIFALIDLPMSLVLDTALLPVHGLMDFGHWLFTDEEPPPPQPGPAPAPAVSP